MESEADFFADLVTRSPSIPVERLIGGQLSLDRDRGL